MRLLSWCVDSDQLVAENAGPTIMGDNENAMTKLTRRSFLKQTSAGAAALSLLPAVPALEPIYHSREAIVPELSGRLPGPMVVHVSDVATGELTLLIGAEEIVFRDPHLIARIIKAARQARHA